MIALLRTLGIALCIAASVAGQGADAGEVAEALGGWRNMWRGSRLHVDHPAADGGRAHRVYRDTLPATAERDGVTHRRAIQALCELAVARADDEIATCYADLVAVTLESGLPAHLHADAVRRIALDAARALTAPAAIHRLMQIAAGDPSVTGRRDHERLRPAAVLLLGQVAHPVARRPVDAALASDDRLLRLAAADALLSRAGPASAEAAAQALFRETDAGIARLLALVVADGLAAHADQLGAARAERVVAMALDALGRHGWRTDVVIIGLCEASRSRVAIPALIDLLARIQAAPDPAALGYLRERTHAALRSLTGAIWPADEPDTWRDFWERERDRLQVPERRDGAPEPGRTTTGFFGIPVHGRRVMFLIDTSGSMKASHSLSGRRTSASSRGTTRLDAAKIELMRCIGGLPEGARVGVIAFEAQIRALTDGLVTKTPSYTRSIRDRVAPLRAAGGTNIWGALAAALDLDDLSWDDTSPPDADEIFLLSDGAPSAGDLTAPQDILDAVRTANRLRGIRIHTVYLGSSDSSFMQDLARENDGIYVRSD